MLNNRDDAYDLLVKLGASRHLLTHLRLVGEAADLLIRGYAELGLDFDAQWIELGVAVHDAGKIEHPEELAGPGALHEPAGKALMLKNGVQPRIADCCISHAAWRTQGLSLEERSVALADKLWKGKREEELELLVIDQVASGLGVDRWEVFETLDSLFEKIAADGTRRLMRSQSA